MLIEYPMMETYAQIAVGERTLFLTHGHVFGPDRLPPLRKGDILAFGHTHIPLAQKADGIFLFNPGSVSLPKNGNPPSYGIFSGESLAVKRMDGTVLIETALV